MLPRGDLLGSEGVEVAPDDERHHPHRRRGHLGGAELLGDTQRSREIGIGVLHERRRDHVRGVSDAGDPEAAPAKLVGDLMRQPGTVGAVEHPHVN